MVQTMVHSFETQRLFVDMLSEFSVAVEERCLIDTQTDILTMQSETC